MSDNGSSEPDSLQNVEAMVSRIRGALGPLASIRRERAEKEQIYLQRGTELDALKEKHTALEQKYDALEKKHGELQAAYDALSGIKKETDKTLEQKAAELAAANVRVLSLEETIGTANTTVERERGNAQAEQKRARELSEQLTIKTRKLNASELERARIQTAYDELELARKDILGKYDKRTKDYQQIVTLFTQLEQEVREALEGDL